MALLRCSAASEAALLIPGDNAIALTIMQPHRLYHKHAPKTCHNFHTLAAKGYYNNTVFHRIIKDFMIQASVADAQPKLAHCFSCQSSTLAHAAADATAATGLVVVMLSPRTSRQLPLAFCVATCRRHRVAIRAVPVAAALPAGAANSRTKSPARPSAL